MTLVNERVLFQRNILVLVLVSVFLVSVITVSISIYVTWSTKEKIESTSKLNILFIIIDDLRPALGCYGDNRAISPNIDQIAGKSILFKNAYSQQALCAPSRTSLLTSRRPDSLHLYDAGSYWRDTVGNFTTLPQHFKDHGYETVSIGKVFHHGIASNNTDDYPYSWSREPFRPITQKYKMKRVCITPDGERHMNLICPVRLSHQPDHTLPDIENADEAIKYLKEKKEKNVPFFLGIGFYKPHIPFKFPEKYLDLYPIESMDLAPNNTMPPKLPKVAYNPWSDLRERDDVKALNLSFPSGPIPDDFQKIIRQGYYSSLSYMDDQLGRILEALEQTGYAQNTAIVLVGDHGWSLGEHQEWSKYSNFEVSLKVPLLLHVPGITEDPEKRRAFTHISALNDQNKTNTKISPKYTSHDFIELVDIFPTLSEMSNIAIPPLCKQYTSDFCSEGLSFWPVVEELTDAPSSEFSWKTAVFSQYPRPSKVPQVNSDQPELKDITIMGYTIRNGTYRYTQWMEFNKVTFIPDWAEIISRELYDEVADPYEVNNLCDEVEFSNVVIEMSKKLKLGWHHAMPPGLFDGPMKHRGKGTVKSSVIS